MELKFSRARNKTKELEVFILWGICWLRCDTKKAGSLSATPALFGRGTPESEIASRTFATAGLNIHGWENYSTCVGFPLAHFYYKSRQKKQPISTKGDLECSFSIHFNHKGHKFCQIISLKVQTVTCALSEVWRKGLVQSWLDIDFARQAYGFLL